MTAIYENYESPWMDDELSILRDAANRFFSTEFVPHKDRWIEQGKVDRDAWNKAGEAGLLCAEIPAQYGGGGGDYRHETIVTEEQFGAGERDRTLARYVVKDRRCKQAPRSEQPEL